MFANHLVAITIAIMYAAYVPAAVFAWLHFGLFVVILTMKLLKKAEHLIKFLWGGNKINNI